MRLRPQRPVPLAILPLLLINTGSLILASIILNPLSTAAVLINVTVDDTLTGSQIAYGPPGAWSLGQTCTTCTARPDPARIVNGFWHDGTFRKTVEAGGLSNNLLTATLSFEGVAVYVYCIVAHSFSAPVGNSLMHFYLDGVIDGVFIEPPTGKTGFQYNRLVYASTALPSRTHTIQLVNGVQNGNQTLTLLDYIVYTREMEELPQSSVPSPIVSATTVTVEAATPSAKRTALHADLSPSSSLEPTGSTSLSTASRALPTSFNAGTPAADPPSSSRAQHSLSSQGSPLVSSNLAGPASPSAVPGADIASTSMRSTVIVALCSVGGAILFMLGFAMWLYKRRRKYVPPETDKDLWATSYESETHLQSPTYADVPMSVSSARRRATAPITPAVDDMPTPRDEKPRPLSDFGVYYTTTDVMNTESREGAAWHPTTLASRGYLRDQEDDGGSSDFNSELSSTAPPSYHP